MARIVLSIGGSVLVPGDKDAGYISKLAGLLKELSSRHRLFVVTGGGKVARYYIENGRELGMPESLLDELGIMATRLNARLLCGALHGLSNTMPPETVEGAASIGSKHRIVVMGGTSPGWTTDFVAASLAESVKAEKLVNATSVDGVYTADPKKDKKARMLTKMTYEELIALAGSGHQKAGPSVVFDPQAARLVAKAGIPLLVVNGRDLAALRNSIEGKKFRGTTVQEV